jgi:O-acetyl-ADP-ribose deacetylase (regulator of RNase III)
LNSFEETREIVIKLDYVQGSLLDYEVDMLVNASNTTLKLGSGVSMVLKRACGPELQHSMDQLRLQRTRANQEISSGDVFITPAFEHPHAKYILHAAVMNYNSGVKQLDAKPTLQTIEVILENTLPHLLDKQDDSMQPVTALFPYLGCGVGGLEKKDVRQVFETFCEKQHDITAEFYLCEL